MSFDSAQISPEPRSSVSSLSSPWRYRRLGIMSLVLAAVAAGLESWAIAIGSAGNWGAATVIAWFVIGFFALGFALGAVAVLARNGRGFGLAAVILSVSGNPLTLVWIFHLLGSKA